MLYQFMQHAAVMRDLADKRILITRAVKQIQSVAKCIRQRGGLPIAFPCLEVICLVEPVQASVRWLATNGVQAAFTSSNGVSCVAHALGDAFVSTFHSVPVIAIGQRTADTLKAAGIEAAWIPQHASQEGLLGTWQQRGLPEHLVFFRAKQGRDMLPAAMKQAGVNVHLVPAYHTVCPDDDASPVIQALHDHAIDAVLIGSARTANHYVRRIGDVQLANRPAIAVISPQVADAARILDLDVQIIAKEASFASLLDALAVWFKNDAKGVLNK